MQAKEYFVFNRKKKLLIPVDVLEEYERKVRTFTENSADYFVLALDLSEDMDDEKLSAEVVKAMKEDCEDAVTVAEILSNQEKIREFLASDVEN